MLRIKRRKMFVDSMREYKVFIDGVQIGEIKNGEVKSFDLPEGHHLVHLEIDWCRSKKISLDVIKGESVTFHVGSSMRWFIYPFMYLLYLSVFRHKYIFIKNETEIKETLISKFFPVKEVDQRKLQTIQF